MKSSLSAPRGRTARPFLFLPLALLFIVLFVWALTTG